MDLGDGPGGVFGDEGFGILGGGGEGGEIGWGADIAEGDADIAEEAPAFDAFDGGIFEEGIESEGIEGEEVAELVGVDEVAGGESDFGGGLGEAVPGASGGAVVAAVDAIADEGPEMDGDGAFEFDGEVGDAEAGIELVRGDDGVGGASGDAAGAFSAAIWEGGIGGERESGEEFGEEEPGTEGGMDEHGGFAVPTDAREGGEVAFEDGAGIDIEALLAAALGEPEIELAELGGEEIVVVVAPGVASDLVRRRGRGVGWRGGEVVDGEDDGCLGTWEDELGVGAAIGVAVEPFHLAGAASGEPVAKFLGVGRGDAWGGAAEGEAEGMGVGDEVGFHGLGGVRARARWASARRMERVRVREREEVSRVK